MKTYFYNFTLEGKNQGYSYLRFDSKSLFSQTRFRISEDEIYTNIFELKLEGDDVLACRHGNQDWIDLSDSPANSFPSCAYPLLLPKVGADPFTYTQISEGDGSVIGEVTLEWDGNDIVEADTQTRKELRRFTMKEGIPVKIDWGGAISYLCDTAEEAVMGSDIDFDTKFLEKGLT